MKLVVGLGNPGKRYLNTRHNVGFVFAEKLASLYKNENWEENRKGNFLFITPNNNLEIVKPQTFMNQSGKSLLYIKRIWKDGFDLNNLYIIHDDLDIKLGSYKIQKGIGPKVHGGLNSIYSLLGTKNFWHVRIGVENREKDSFIKIGNFKFGKRKKTPGEKYVLQNFTGEEERMLGKAIDNALKDLKDNHLKL